MRVTADDLARFMDHTRVSGFRGRARFSGKQPKTLTIPPDVISSMRLAVLQ